MMRWMMRLGVGIVVVEVVDWSKNRLSPKTSKIQSPKTIRYTEELSFLDLDGQLTSEFYDGIQKSMILRREFRPSLGGRLTMRSPLLLFMHQNSKVLPRRLQAWSSCSYFCWFMDTKSLIFDYTQELSMGLPGLSFLSLSLASANPFKLAESKGSLSMPLSELIILAANRALDALSHFRRSTPLSRILKSSTGYRPSLTIASLLNLRFFKPQSFGIFFTSITSLTSLHQVFFYRTHINTVHLFPRQAGNGLIFPGDLVLMVLRMSFPTFSCSLQKRSSSGGVAQLICGRDREWRCQDFCSIDDEILVTVFTKYTGAFSKDSAVEPTYRYQTIIPTR